MYSRAALCRQGSEDSGELPMPVHWCVPSLNSKICVVFYVFDLCGFARKGPGSAFFEHLYGSCWSRGSVRLWSLIVANTMIRWSNQAISDVFFYILLLCAEDSCASGQILCVVTGQPFVSWITCGHEVIPCVFYCLLCLFLS